MAAQLISANVAFDDFVTVATLDVIIPMSAIDHLILISEGYIAEVQSIVCTVSQDLYAIRVYFIDPVTAGEVSDT